MKNISKLLWGLALILVGGIFALNACGLTDIEVFFDGWWTLFIIVPCFVGLFNEREKLGNLIGIGIGVFLLLCCQGVLEFDMVWKLALPAIIIIIGAKLILTAIFGDKGVKLLEKSKEDGAKVKVGCATFSGQDMRFDGEIFEGAEATAIFGGVNCDLRNAILQRDCAINATAIFGGIDIFLPDNVNVKVSSNSIFGGVSQKNHRPTNPGAVTVYINATCVFGGVDVK